MHFVDLGESYSKVYLLAKFGFDTAEKEPCKVCPIPRNAAAGVPSEEAAQAPAVGDFERVPFCRPFQGPFSAVSKGRMLQDKIAKFSNSTRSSLHHYRFFRMFNTFAPWVANVNEIS